jgi:cyclase
MPCLLLKGAGLVKTTRFRDPKYVGDPVNAVRIFNEREVDELVLLDISATPDAKKPQFELIREIVSEAFMPIAYGGGIRDLDHARKILGSGVEKIVINTHAAEDREFVERAVELFGSQSVLVSLDVKRGLFGKYEVYTHSGRKRTGRDPVEFAKDMEEAGAGELLVNSIDRDGTMSGYDLELIRSATGAVKVPVIACGGAGKIQDFTSAVKLGGASAVAAGSLFIFYGKHCAVLINYPEQKVLNAIL